MVRFGTFEVDRRTGELRRNGMKIKLQEQPLQVLLSLVERPGELVTRDELRARLWQDGTFVDFDHGLNTAVRRLRDALGDSADSPRFVETVARRGYRFLVPVEDALPGAVTAPPEVKPRPLRTWWLLGATAGAVVLAGIIWKSRTGQPAVPPKTFTERRLTANAPELPVTDAAISRDGRYLAFSDATGFYLREIDTGETHPQTLPLGFNAKPRAWFPDGTHLLATWVAGPDATESIWVISLIGGSPHQLVPRGSWPAVSPDGSRVVYLAAPVEFKEAYLNKEIWVMQADGEEPQRLLAGGDDFFGQPAWAPDGKRIAYVRGKFAFGMPWVRGQLEILDLATRHTNVLVAMPALGSAVTWLPDGQLVYSLDEPIPNQNDSNLWTLPLDRSGRAQGSATRLTRGPGVAYLIGASADGNKLVFFRRTIEPDVYVTDLDAHGARLTSPRRLTLDERATSLIPGLPTASP